MAAIAASFTLRGVSKSGSPEDRPMMSRPAAFSARALLASRWSAMREMRSRRSAMRFMGMGNPAVLAKGSETTPRPRRLQPAPFARRAKISPAAPAAPPATARITAASALISGVRPSLQGGEDHHRQGGRGRAGDEAGDHHVVQRQGEGEQPAGRQRRGDQRQGDGPEHREGAAPRSAAASSRLRSQPASRACTTTAT